MKLVGPLVLVFMCLAASGCNDPRTTPEPTDSPTSTLPIAFQAHGTITVPADLTATARLQSSDLINLGGPCVTTAGFGDIAEGAQVLITDESNTKLAVGNLQPGVVVKGASENVDDARCEFAFEVDDVPTGHALYSVHLGNSFRGEQTYTIHDLYVGVGLSIG